MSEEKKQTATEVADERVYTLRRPFVFEDKQITTLTLDFDRLTGEDVLSAERRFYNEGAVPASAKEVTKAFQIYIVAAAAGVPVELVRALPAKDFTSVTLDAQNFLLR